MEQVALTKKEKSRGKELLDIMYGNSIIFNCMDIDKMDVAEAKRVWRLLESYLPLVASMASSRKRDMKHIEVLNAMHYLQKKADGGKVDER